MKALATILATGGLIATLAAQLPSAVVRSAPRNGWRGPDSAGPNQHRPATHRRSSIVYVITGGSQFGTIDLQTGSFVPIGPGIPPDVGTGLVPDPRKPDEGPARSLLSLAFSGNLDAIDPKTGIATVVGATGLHDCSKPDSPYDPQCANALGRLGETLYATDFAQNLYRINCATGKATLIGPTGIPALPFVPGPAPNGLTNVYDESLFSVGGKLYANFAVAVLNPNGPPTIVSQPAIYRINAETGQATFVSYTELGLLGIVPVHDRVYAFSAASEQVKRLDVHNGQTAYVSDVDPAVGTIGGATPVYSSAGRGDAGEP